MRKLLLAATLILSCLITSCSYTELEDLDNPKAADEILSVKVKAMREDLPDGYFAYDSGDRRYYGHYKTSDGEKLGADEIFEEVTLEVGKPRISAPLGFDYNHNLNILLDFDGYLEIESDPAGDDRLRLAHSVNNPETTDIFSMVIENPIRARSPMNLNVCPLGRFVSGDYIVITDTLTDCEYFINIHAYDINERPKVSARLRIKTVEDEHYPSDEVESAIYGSGEERTRFVEIELISCEYGDEIG